MLVAERSVAHLFYRNFQVTSRVPQSPSSSEDEKRYSKTGNWFLWLGGWKVEGHRWSPGQGWIFTCNLFFVSLSNPWSCQRPPNKEDHDLHGTAPTAIAECSHGDVYTPAMGICTSCRVGGSSLPSRQHGLLELMCQVQKYVALIPKWVLQVGNGEWGRQGEGNYWQVHSWRGPESSSLYIAFTYIHLLNVPFICIQADYRVAALTNVCTLCKLDLHYYWNESYRKISLGFDIQTHFSRNFNIVANLKKNLLDPTKINYCKWLKVL